MADTTTPDTQAPVLTFLQIPDVIDLANGRFHYPITAGATDIGTGVSRVNVYTDLPTDSPSNSSLMGFGIGPQITMYGHQPPPVLDYTPWDSGAYTADVTFDTNGRFRITSVEVRDRADNYRVYSAADLEAMQINTSFQVINSSAYGSAVGETMIANGEDNLMAGMGGDDVIDGGAGVDTAMYGGPRQAFSIARADGAMTVTDLTGVEGIDQLLNVEQLRFDDMFINFDPDGTLAQLVRLYRAAFDRAPDSAGLTYWTPLLDSALSDFTLNGISQGFVASSEFKTLYGADASNDTLVRAFYENVLGRAGDGDDIAYWSGVLDRQAASVADVLVAFSESAEHKAVTAELIGQGIEYVAPWMLS